MKTVFAALAFLLTSACGSASPQPTGEPCMMDEDCEGGVCLNMLEDPDVGFPGGMCSAECIRGCDGDATCLHHRRYPADECPEEGGEPDCSDDYCIPNCETNADCRTDEGYQCVPRGLFGFFKVCLPPDVQ